MLRISRGLSLKAVLVVKPRIGLLHNVYPLPRRVYPSTTVRRTYANATDPKDFDDVFNESPALQKIKENPDVLQAMVDIAKLLESKGYITPGEKPGLWTIMKMMNDSEIKIGLIKLKQQMDKAGIELNPDDVMKVALTLGLHK